MCTGLTEFFYFAPEISFVHFKHFIYNFNKGVLKSVIMNYTKYIFLHDITEYDKLSFLKQFILLITFTHLYATNKKLPEFNFYELANITNYFKNLKYFIMFLLKNYKGLLYTVN